MNQFTPQDLDLQEFACEKANRFVIIFIFLCGLNQLLHWPSHGIRAFLYAALFSVCFGFSFFKGMLRWATVGTFILLFVDIASTFPYCANHNLLKLIIAILLAGSNLNDEPQSGALVRGLKLLVVICFFWSGIQKIAYGTYFDGAMLSFLSSIKPELANFLTKILPGTEMENLSGNYQNGPYRFVSVPGLFLSNMVYISEILCAIFLLIPKLSRIGVALTFLVVFTIEIAMRELLFGLYIYNLLLLFLPTVWLRRSLPLFLSIGIILIMSRANVISEIFFHL